MFKTCIYCNRSLGRNETVENFPVGRRLAFDGERGRLWVICERCRRWNLSPLEERWEAIEQCDREFRETRESFSTDNIGLARTSEGLELVRIGRPQRREFAAWRYGRQFLRRRIKTLTIWGVKIGAAAAAAISGVFVFHLFAEQQERIVARVRSDDGRRLYVPLKDAKKVRLIRAAEREDGWMLSVPCRYSERNWGIFGAWAKGKRVIEEFDGPVAIRAAGRILPSINSFGGSNSQVQDAVKLIEDARGPERVFHAASRVPKKRRPRTSFIPVEQSEVSHMDAAVRLALEMSAHEETERRAFEGELAALEEAWREAEEIAAIADRLLIPESVENWIRRQKQRLAGSR
ncbi:MAG: hypothetical protein JSV86_14135 [Gemmatimonadota bacterium]|nr:MAG: hypothetical protein JSV86_14135 [Gemmatimonadota bacterium]